MAVNFPNVLVVHPGTRIKRFAEFIAAAKKDSYKLDFASTGPGSAFHLAGELLNDMAQETATWGRIIRERKITGQ
jgi:tripartite-type tricarboxylate transporter receptor subunit TctC